MKLNSVKCQLHEQCFDTLLKLILLLQFIICRAIQPFYSLQGCRAVGAIRFKGFPLKNRELSIAKTPPETIITFCEIKLESLAAFGLLSSGIAACWLQWH